MRLTGGGRDEGAIAILAAVLATVLFGFGAIVVDLGFARTVRQQAQDSADTAALAGADALYMGSARPRFGPARTAVKASARDNFQVSSWRGCRATPPAMAGVSWDGGSRETSCIQFGKRAGESASLVFVAMPARHLDPILGGIFQSNGVDVGGSSVAGTTTTTVSKCGLCVFGQLSVASGSRGDVTGGSSLAAQSATLSTPYVIDTLVVAPSGRITFAVPPTAAPPDNAAYNPLPVIDAVDGPLAGAPVPVGRGPLRTDTSCDGTRDLRRGTYVNLDITGTCILRGGVTTVTGTLTIEPGAKLVGSGATLLFTGASNIDMRGELLELGGTRNGFSLYWLSTQPLVLAGKTVDLGGDVFAKSVDVTLSAESVTVGGAMSTGDLTLVSPARLTVTAGGAPVVEHSGLALVQ